MPVGAPVERHVRGEPPRERRQRDEGERGAQREEAGDAEHGQHEERLRSDAGEETVDRGAWVGQQQRDDRVVAVGPHAVGVQRRQDDVRGEDERRHTAGRQGRTQPAGPPDQDHHADRGDRQAEILLHQEQRERPQGGGAVASTHERGKGEGQQGQREGHLVELRRDRGLQPPGQHVGETDAGAGPPAQVTHGARGHDGDGEAHQDRLGREQRHPGGEQGVERGEHHQERVEVVAEDHELLALDGDDGSA